MGPKLVCRWLGLPEDAWPPDHYRLLGLQPGETNPDRIEQEVHDRLERVRRYQLTHPEIVTEAMNRLAQAFVCLTDDRTKREYDAKLGCPCSPTAARPAAATQAPVPAAVAPVTPSGSVPPVAPSTPSVQISTPTPVADATMPAGAEVVQWSPGKAPEGMPRGAEVIPWSPGTVPMTADIPRGAQVIQWPTEPLPPDAPPDDARVVPWSEDVIPPTPETLPPGAEVIPWSPDARPPAAPAHETVLDTADLRIDTVLMDLPALATPEDVPPPSEPPSQPLPYPPPDPAAEVVRCTPCAKRGLGTKRALYCRIARTRQLLDAWREAGKIVSDPQRRLRRPSEATELIRQMKAIINGLNSFPAMMGRAGQPGYMVATLARQPLVVPTLQTLLPSQRIALARDWQCGLRVLEEYRRFLRLEVKAMRRRSPIRQGIRAARAYLNEEPGALLILLALLSINVAIWRTYIQPLPSFTSPGSNRPASAPQP